MSKTRNPLRSAYRRWLAIWWKHHHPAGGGEPPTLEEAFAAGAMWTVEAVADEIRERAEECLQQRKDGKNA